ncbi:hypothetical protein BBP40_010460 [Aspergillus hancockii]|nr:hypothetical protein BBP40_010460 [Aspergillus hancockii]
MAGDIMPTGKAHIEWRGQPNDEEQDRMDLMHHIYTMILEAADFISRPSLPSHSEYAGYYIVERHALTGAQGDDLSPIQPNWIPPNCIFKVDDFEADWVYSRPFDYTHGRELAGSVSNFDRLFRQGFTHLKPGGYIELQCFRIDVFADGASLLRATYTVEMCSFMKEASAKLGKPIASIDEWEDKLIKAGFEDVECKISSI